MWIGHVGPCALRLSAEANCCDWHTTLTRASDAEHLTQSACRRKAAQHAGVEPLSAIGSGEWGCPWSAPAGPTHSAAASREWFGRAGSREWFHVAVNTREGADFAHRGAARGGENGRP